LLRAEGGMTTVERTLLDRGENDLVRQVRLRFQETMDEAFTGVVARLTDREILTYKARSCSIPNSRSRSSFLAPGARASVRTVASAGLHHEGGSRGQPSTGGRLAGHQLS